MKLVGTAILAAIIIMLQLAGGGIHIGTVSISLVLVPIVVGAVLYGPAVGSLLGAVFGIIVIIMILVGMDPASMLMLQFNAPATVITCLVKGILAGFVPGLVYKAFRKAGRGKTGTVAAAILAPVMNTGFYILMVTFVFTGLMEKSYNLAGTGAVFAFIVVAVLSNFLVELVSTAVLSPAVIAAVNAATSSHHGEN